MSSNEAEEEKKFGLPFIYTWNLERLVPSTSSSGGNWVYSYAFPGGGYKWKLALYSWEIKAEVAKRHSSLFLSAVDIASLPRCFVIEMTVESSIPSESTNYYSKKKVVHKFKRDESDPFLMPLETLNCPSSGFLVVEIVDLTILQEKKECLSCKLANDCLYTWRIDGFSKLTKESYKSGPFLIKDHIWHLLLYPKGDKENNCISLCLELDTTNTISCYAKAHVELCLDLVDQINGRNYKHQLSGNFSRSRGRSKLITLDDLHKPSKGFLVNDCCIIKVTILELNIS